MQWFYAKDGQQIGPVSTEDLINKRRNGEITTATLVWKEGMPEWVAYETIPELNTASASAPPAAPTPSNTTIPQPPPGSTSTIAPDKPIPTYLWQSIAATLLCCLPFGVVGIIYASQVQGHLSRGDYPSAEEASRKAKLWTTVSFIVGLVVGILYIGASVFVGFNSASNTVVPPTP